MAYTPTTWVSGDVVTAQKMNKLEQGVASGGCLITNVSQNGETYTLDKTAGEIYQAVTSGTMVVCHREFDGLHYYSAMLQCRGNDTGCSIKFYDVSENFEGSSSSYPSYTSGGIY